MRLDLVQQNLSLLGVDAVTGSKSPLNRTCAPDVDRLPGFFEDHDLVGPEDERQEMARSMRRTALVAVGLGRPHSRDLSTATSGNSCGEP